jgi:hypothetical protein
LFSYLSQYVLALIYSPYFPISHYGAGSRNAGHYYAVKNYQPGTGLKSVAVWTAEAGMTLCANIANKTIVNGTCSAKIVYNSDTGYTVPDTPPDILLTLSRQYYGVLVFVQIMVFLPTLFVMAVFFAYRRSQLLKSTNRKMTAIFLIGCLIGGGRILSDTLVPNDSTCNVGIWFGHCAFFFIFSTLFVKTW